MIDVLDLPLSDGELLAEIEMATELMILATECEDAVSQQAIDAILGVQPSRERTRHTGRTYPGYGGSESASAS